MQRVRDLLAKHRGTIPDLTESRDHRVNITALMVRPSPLLFPILLFRDLIFASLRFSCTQRCRTRLRSSHLNP